MYGNRPRRWCEEAARPGGYLGSFAGSEWTALDLAHASKVGVATIRRAEMVWGGEPNDLAKEAAIGQAFEAAGNDFVEDNGGGEGGVRFRKPRRSRMRN